MAATCPLPQCERERDPISLARSDAEVQPSDFAVDELRASPPTAADCSIGDGAVTSPVIAALLLADNLSDGIAGMSMTAPLDDRSPHRPDECGFMNPAGRKTRAGLSRHACSSSERIVAALLFERQRSTWSLDPLLGDEREPTQMPCPRAAFASARAPRADLRVANGGHAGRAIR